MRVFLTGATGFVGSAVIDELVQAGHQVLGLTRSHKGAQLLKAAGAEAHHGTLEDLDSLRRGAESTDGAIHCGFVHDFANYVKSCETDRAVIETVGSALAGSDRPFVVTSGLAGIAPGRLSTEDDATDSRVMIRGLSEEITVALAPRGVRASVLRLAPSVHGDGDHGFVPMLINIAREKGFAAYIGEGANRWPGVHRHDAARLYRLALEKGVAGSRFHGAAEEGVPTRQIAEVIGRRLNLPVRSITGDEVEGHFGWMGKFFGLDMSASSALTRERLGWQPTEPGLLEDIDREAYFGA